MTRRPVIAYLDQSDISYLAMGRGPAGTDYVQVRDRLQRLCERGLLRVRMSFAHFTESLRLRRRSRRAVVDFLRGLPNATFVRNFPNEFWQAEVEGRAPEIREGRIATAEPLFWAPFLLHALADRPSTAIWIWVRQGLKRELNLGLPKLDQRFVRLVMQEEAPTLFDAARIAPPSVLLRYWLSLRLTHFLRKAMERRGYEHPFDFIKSYRRGTYGFGHLDPMLRRWGPAWSSARAAAAMPALALGIAINGSIGRDLGRLDLGSDERDVWHASYAAYSDVATADRRVLDATKEVRRRLHRPRWYRAGHLHELVDDVEAG